MKYPELPILRSDLALSWEGGVVLWKPEDRY